MDLSIIILNLNTQNFLHDCLRSLFSGELSQPSSPYTWEVIVADNGSTDGSVTMVKAEFSSVKLVENGSNLGFAKGNNAALPYARGRYVLFLNSDTKAPPGTLAEMITFMDNHYAAGAATCHLELFDGRIDPNCHRGFPTPLTALFHFSGLDRLFPQSPFFGGYYQAYKDLKTTHEIDAAEGAFIFIRREAAETVKIAENKWWDEDFFFFAEDLDFCYRLKQKGWKIMYHPKVKIYHYKGATHGFNKQGKAALSPEEKGKLVRATTDGMKLFYQKHYRQVYPAWVTFLVFLAIDSLAKIRGLKGGI